MIERDWRRYDYRSVVFRPKAMSPEALQSGADWLYSRFYSPARVVRRTLRALVHRGAWAALFTGLVGFAYLRDNRRWKIRGRDPAAAARRAPRLLEPAADL